VNVEHVDPERELRTLATRMRLAMEGDEGVESWAQRLDEIADELGELQACGICGCKRVEVVAHKRVRAVKR